MTQGFRARLSGLVQDRAFQVLTLAAAGVLATAAAAAPTRGGFALKDGAFGSAVSQVVSVAIPAAPQALELVWTGADVDGDGAADFANPTGQEARTHDAYGSGAFGASRDGGVRQHEGVDFVAEAGQAVVAPISGYVTKIGYAYAGDDMRFIEITNPALRYAARVFYVEPTVAVGDTVAVGRPIATARSLQPKYPAGMTDHVHLEIMDRSGERIDANRVLTAEWSPAARG